MAKKGMKRPERTHTEERNDQAAVPELQGKSKTGKQPANPIVAGTHAPSQKVWQKGAAADQAEQYTVFDNDLARDNLENDVPAADI